MRRDMDLARELLLRIEADPDYDGHNQFWIAPNEEGGAGDLDVPGFSFEQIIYHLEQLIDAGHLKGKHSMSGPVISGLTPQGHDFLDAVRDPDVWDKTKKGALAAGGFTMDLLRDLAKGFMKKQIEDRTGVKL